MKSTEERIYREKMLLPFVRLRKDELKIFGSRPCILDVVEALDVRSHFLF